MGTTKSQQGVAFLGFLANKYPFPDDSDSPKHKIHYERLLAVRILGFYDADARELRDFVSKSAAINFEDGKVVRPFSTQKSGVDAKVYDILKDDSYGLFRAAIRKDPQVLGDVLDRAYETYAKYDALRKENRRAPNPKVLPGLILRGLHEAK